VHRNHDRLFKDDFGEFVEFLHEGLGWEFFSPQRFMEAMGIDLQTLAMWAHVRPGEIDLELTSKGICQFLSDSLRVLHAAFEVTGNVEKTIEWYKNSPLLPFDRKAPRELVAEGRAVALLGYIKSLSAGFTG
jgi:hypothetical protein